MNDKPRTLTAADREDIRNIVRSQVLEAKANGDRGGFLDDIATIFEPETDEQRHDRYDVEDLALNQVDILVATNRFSTVLKSLRETHPILANPLSHFPIRVSERTTAIAIGDTHIYINPNWWANKTHAELRHCACFVSLVTIYDLRARGKAIENVDHGRWEIASNLVCNRHLIDQGIGVMPAEGAFVTSISSNQTTTEVYEMLLGMTEEAIINAVWPFRPRGQVVEHIESIVDRMKQTLLDD